MLPPFRPSDTFLPMIWVSQRPAVGSRIFGIASTPPAGARAYFDTVFTLES